MAGRPANGGKGQVGAIRGMVAEGSKASAQRRLTSWKEIAAFLGRDERTAKRWESSRGLPVGRMPGAGHSSVFAYTDEIETWMRAGEPAIASAKSTAEPEKSNGRLPARRYIGGWIALVAVIIAAAGGLLEFGRTASFSPASQDAHTTDPAAAEYYRSGLHAWQTRTPAGLALAVADFRRAVAQDPRFAAAYAGLADAYSLEAEFTAIPPRDAYPQAIAAAKRAIAIDPSLASAHAALAFAEFYWSRDTAAAEREFQRALALDPSSATAHHWYATFLMTMGRSGTALEQIGKAESLDSESTAIPADKGLILFHAGKTDQAIKLLTQIENEQPDFASPHRYLAVIWLAENRDTSYLRELKLEAQARRDFTDATLADAGAKGLSNAGHVGMLRAILDVQRSLYRAGKESAYALAVTSAKLGDDQQAIAYLSASVQRHETENIALAIDPPFAGLRGDRRFAEVLARAGLRAPG